MKRMCQMMALAVAVALSLHTAFADSAADPGARAAASVVFLHLLNVAFVQCFTLHRTLSKYLPMHVPQQVALITAVWKCEDAELMTSES